MQLVYKIIVASLAFTGSLSLLLSEEVNLLFALPGLAMIPGYYRYIRGYEPVSRWLIAGLALMELLVVAIDSVMVSGDFFIAVAHMTIVFQALKSFDMREPWDPLQVYFMSMLQIVMTSELTLSVAMGGVFVVFLFIFMAALVFSHFMKEGTLDRVRLRQPIVTVSIVALLGTVVFFISVPRVKGEIWGRHSSSGLKTVGFSDDVDFGSFGRVLEDSSIALRVEVEGTPLPLYWRGQTLDYFDGQSWHDTIEHLARVYRKEGRHVVIPDYRGDLTVQKIIIEPMDTKVVFGLGKIVAVESSAWKVYRSRTGVVTMPQKENRRFTYTVYSAPSGDEAVSDRDRYLQVPGAMERVAELARTVAGDGTPLQKAGRIDTHLRQNYRYSLENRRPPPGVTPLLYFLFDSKQGFCEHYATAMVMMLRNIGIPARLVTGFTGGEENTYGNYVIVRQSNAHSWVEADINGKWTRFDPTPLAPAARSTGVWAMALDSIRMSWYRYVVGFTSRDQIRMLQSFSTPVLTLPEFRGVSIKVRPVYVLGVIIPLVLAGLWFMRKLSPGRRLSYESRLYVRLKRTIKRKGGEIGPSSTPLDVLREARRLGFDNRELQEFIRLYEDARFGGKSLEAGDRERLRAISR